jgi:CheY-like chemotaxis protein
LRRLTSTFGTRRILIVDDNEVSRYVLRELLSQPWLQISEASNGTQALEYLREGRPDAVILDLLMPDMSGFEVLRDLRSRAGTENLPVLIYTSKPVSEQERLELDSLGAAIVRKEDVSSRLSAQPFLEWIRTSGIIPEAVGEADAAR